MSPADQFEHHHDTPEQAAGQPEAESRTPQVMKGGAGNVDKIRDILFGSQMRDYEARFARLEEALLKETAEIRESNRRRFDQLETYIKGEFEALQNRLRSEREDWSEMGNQHSRELRELNESLSRRVRALDDRGVNVERDLRNQLLQQSRDFGDQLRSRHDEVSTLLEKRFSELHHGKTDRAALATLFTEVALRLNDQFQMPAADE
jgi:hypothetical protein